MYASRGSAQVVPTNTTSRPSLHLPRLTPHIHPTPIDPSINPLQTQQTPHHGPRTPHKQANPTIIPHLVENRIRPKPIPRITRLDPEPIRDRNGRTQRQRRQRGNRIRRRKQQQINHQTDGRDRVEPQIRRRRQPRRPRWQHEVDVDGAQGPVEDTDEEGEGRRGDGEGVFDAEEGGGESQVCGQAEEEGQGCERQADDGQVLEVPAIGLIAVALVLARMVLGSGC